MKKSSLDSSDDDEGITDLTYNFQTPFPARNSPSERRDEGRKTQRRVSFSESKLPDEYLKELSPPGTPTKEKAQVTHVDSPYTDSPVMELNDDEMDALFERVRKKSPFSLASNMSPTCDLKSLPHLIG